MLPIRALIVLLAIIADVLVPFRLDLAVNRMARPRQRRARSHRRKAPQTPVRAFSFGPVHNTAVAGAINHLRFVGYHATSYAQFL